MARRIDLHIPRGEDRDLIFTVLRKDSAGVEAPLDLTLSNTKAWFTVKDSQDDPDADALIDKTQGAGITLNVPAHPDKNRMTVQVNAADWQEAWPAILYYDVQIETQGDQFRSHYGFVKSPHRPTLA